MAIINKQKLTETDLRKHQIWSIVYDLAFDQHDYELIKEHISYKGDALYINIPTYKNLDMEILYLTNIISPDFNKFHEKEFNKLVISYNKPLELSTYVSVVVRRDPKKIIFEDGFVMESNNDLKIR